MFPLVSAICTATGAFISKRDRLRFEKGSEHTSILKLSRLSSKDDQHSISGYGFELTFRLRKAPENSNSSQDIPLWPCKLLQYLAKYVFKTGTQFHAGHHIPFGHVLPNLYSPDGDTRIHDLLITNDRELKSFRTNLGSVEFLQVQFVEIRRSYLSISFGNSSSVASRMNWKPLRNAMWLRLSIFSVLSGSKAVRILNFKSHAFLFLGRVALCWSPICHVENRSSTWFPTRSKWFERKRKKKVPSWVEFSLDAVGAFSTGSPNIVLFPTDCLSRSEL